MLKKHTPVPSIMLKTMQGQTVRLNERRGKRPTVLLFLPEADTRLLDVYAPAEDGLAQYNAALWSITPTEIDAVVGRVLLDTSGGVRGRFPEGHTPGIVVLDRYTAPLLWHFGDRMSDYPSSEDVVEAVRLSEWSCVI